MIDICFHVKDPPTRSVLNFRKKYLNNLNYDILKIFHGSFYFITLYREWTLKKEEIIGEHDSVLNIFGRRPFQKLS